MNPHAAHDTLKTGFQHILDDITGHLQQGASLGEAIHDIVTLGARVDWSHGMQSLTATQTALLELAQDVPLCAPDAALPQGVVRHFIGVWSYGRIWLDGLPPADAECRLIAAVDVPAALYEAATARAAQIEQERRRSDVEMDAFYAGCSEDDLRQALFEVHESVDQTDPVLLYVDGETITNFGKFNNLQARNGADLPDSFFARSRHTSLADWSREERVLVFCLYWLRVAGCRGEEFNGRQLHLAALHAYLDKRLDDFRTMAPRLVDECEQSVANTIEAKARILARCKRDSAHEVLTYRWINGLNFYKEERLHARSALRELRQTLPPGLHSYFAGIGIDPDAHATLQELFAASIARMAESGFACSEPGLNAFEALLKTIVESAIEATRSDVGMTRGFRDIQRWRQAFASGAYADICNWPPGDHYCAVFPSEGLFERLQHKPEMLVKILYACSGRMQFNSWHYLPGHCPRENVPAGRHFYIPPRMPDTAVWSDQHHAGHVHAGVRNAMRCPEQIEVDGHAYAGMVDLRLFRQRGHAYTDDELFQAMAYSNCVRAAYQALADYLAHTDGTLLIEAFDKDWYNAHFQARCADAALAASQTSEATAAAAVLETSSVAVANSMSELFRILCSHATTEKTALVEARHGEPECTLTYRELVHAALALRKTLASHGIAPGACVTVWSQRPLHQALAIVSGLANGITIHPVNPALSAAMLEGQLLHARPSLLIADGADAMPEGLASSTLASTICMRWNEVFGNVALHGVHAVDAALAAANANDANEAGTSANDHHAGLLIYTSGTTGEPKGVRLGWSAIRANVRYAINTLGYQPGWVAGSLLPRFHTFTLMSDVLPALLLGGRAVLTDTFELARAKSIVDAFRRHGVQSYSAAPIILEVCCRLRAWQDVLSLRFAVAGAAPLQEKTRQSYGALFGHPVIPCYGLTETTCFATISPPSDIRPGSAGRAAGIELCVLDESGEQLAPGATGELAMRGPSVIRQGYFRDHEKRFAKSFNQDGWFLTGDIGHIDEDGYVYVTGRKKNMVIRGGEKVYLEDLDRCLFEHLGIADCASIAHCTPGAPDEAWTFIVPVDGQSVPRERIETLVRKMLTPKHMPDRIHFIERVPRTLSGKASLRELQALACNADACVTEES